MSLECTNELCLARSIDEVEAACAAWPAFKACRFQTSSRRTASTLTMRSFCGPPLARRRLSGPPPLPPPSQGGEKKAAWRNNNAPLGGRLLNPFNPNFAPPKGEAPSEPAKAIAAQQELRPPKTRASKLGEGEAPCEPAEAIAAQQELRPTETRPPSREGEAPSAGKRRLRLSRSFALAKPGHRIREGEAPSEPDFTTARHEASSFQNRAKTITACVIRPVYHLLTPARFDNLPHARQTMIKSLIKVSQPRMVKAHQVQDRRVQVGNVTAAFDGVEAQFVGRSDGLAPLDACTGQPHRETIGIVIAPRFVDSFTGGSGPNSPPHTTSVSSQRPVRFRSASSAATG